MRAKSHDQRKGQWLVNKIRAENNYKYNRAFQDAYNEDNKEKTMGHYWKALVEQLLFNMENDEFDKYMEDYNK